MGVVSTGAYSRWGYPRSVRSYPVQYVQYIQQQPEVYSGPRNVVANVPVGALQRPGQTIQVVGYDAFGKAYYVTVVAVVNSQLGQEVARGQEPQPVSMSPSYVSYVPPGMHGEGEEDTASYDYSELEY